MSPERYFDPYDIDIIPETLLETYIKLADGRVANGNETTQTNSKQLTNAR